MKHTDDNKKPHCDTSHAHNHKMNCNEKSMQMGSAHARGEYDRSHAHPSSAAHDHKKSHPVNAKSSHKDK